MPKIGMEAVRKNALIHATIAEIGEAGTLEVTVSQIARRAGMSSALAHHYFGSKEKMFLETMRFVLRQYGKAVRSNLKTARTPQERIRAITDSSFDSSQFEREVIGAWLNFYVRALRSDETRRLLQVYARRLQSNLLFDLRKLMDSDSAEMAAQGLAALIDGFYIRAALQDDVPDRERIKSMVGDYLNFWLEKVSHG
ncbi:transcriptional regulator BetI [Pseudooceanicola sp. HF7]|uniref:transcriptional regulator BetI n=1 Tax=Pseudooceanicola sp. HF7 TaxID=2721560 RepID=UPI001431DB38|nr:transcriptional regulator BetI [Pseudooceanicola sp. HF7]NIZ08994.1 transcriptional regulator BetI [Pseudooceanicola sp. HF7]